MARPIRTISVRLLLATSAVSHSSFAFLPNGIVVPKPISPVRNTRSSPTTMPKRPLSASSDGSVSVMRPTATTDGEDPVTSGKREKSTTTANIPSGNSNPRTEAAPSVSLRTVSPAGDEVRMNMPTIGLGTYKFKKGSGEARKAVLDALALGYRRVDTAFVYGGEKTEVEVGEAVAEAVQGFGGSGGDDAIASRADVFLTTKQWRAYHGYDATLRCLDVSLRRLRTDYVDLYLIHWPGPAYNTMARSSEAMERSPDGAFLYARDGHSRAGMAALRAETWRAMEDAVYAGKCRAIGVSNFAVGHLRALKENARIWPPAVNQVELHPYSPQTELVQYCREEGIIVEAYASLGGQDSGKKTWRVLGGPLMERDEVRRVAQKHGRTAAQVLLRWAVQRGCAVIPKSTNVEHMKLNLEAVSGVHWVGDGLDEEDMTLISSLDKSGTSEAKVARLCWVRDPLKHLDFD